MKHWVWIASLLLLGAMPVTARSAYAIIEPVYGNDDRIDLYQETDPQLLRLADSTVTLVRQSRLSLEVDENGIYFQTYGVSLRRASHVCSSEAFADQQGLGFCSGALVGPDLVLTAGHCIEKQADCQHTWIAFGFGLKTRTTSLSEVRSGEVYNCKSIVSRSDGVGKADYATADRARLPARSGDARRRDRLSQRLARQSVGRCPCPQKLENLRL
jgi:hypothetical protein